MANTVLTVKGKVREDSAFIVTARLRQANDAGTPTVPANISSVTLKVWDTTTPATPTLVVPTGATLPYTGTALDPADVFLPTLNTGYLASDDDGFNFRADLHGSYVPEGGHKYTAEFLIVPVSGDPFNFAVELTAVETYSL